MDFHQIWYVHWYYGDLGLLMGKFRQIFMEFSSQDTYIFCFRMITWVNINRFSPYLVYALKLWRSGLGLLQTCIYSRFLDNDLSKYQGILTKLGTCIDMKEIWFEIGYGQISSMFNRVICPQQMAGYYSLMFIFALSQLYWHVYIWLPSYLGSFFLSIALLLKGFKYKGGNFLPAKVVSHSTMAAVFQMSHIKYYS